MHSHRYRFNPNMTNNLPPHLINHHLGSSIMFNLFSASRFRARDNTKRERWGKKDDLPLLVRLKIDEYAWIVGHSGHVEIFRSPLFVQAVQNKTEPNVVHLKLRNWTKRKGDAITRMYAFCFESVAEAESFVFNHNCFLRHSKEKEKDKSSEETRHDEDEEEEDEEEEDEEEEDGDEGDADEDNADETDGDIWGDFENTQDPFSEYISD